MEHFLQIKKNELYHKKETVKDQIRTFLKENRIPSPISLEFFEHHADNFIKNEVTARISTLALIKIS